VGGLINFPRTGIRQNDTEWQDSAERSPSVLRSTRKTSDASLVTWLDAKRLRDGDDDGGDGGGAAA
jgi:hypothetical protein